MLLSSFGVLFWQSSGKFLSKAFKIIYMKPPSETNYSVQQVKLGDFCTKPEQDLKVSYTITWLEAEKISEKFTRLKKLKYSTTMTCNKLWLMSKPRNAAVSFERCWKVIERIPCFSKKTCPEISAALLLPSFCAFFIHTKINPSIRSVYVSCDKPNWTERGHSFSDRISFVCSKKNQGWLPWLVFVTQNQNCFG